MPDPTETPAPYAEPISAVTIGLRERLDVALGESLDRCTRCKICDAQLDAIMAVVGPPVARLAELESTLEWHTTCTSCAAVLDSSVRETARREVAEELLESAYDLIGADPCPGTATWGAKALRWEDRYQALVRQHAAGRAEPSAEPEPEPEQQRPMRLANVEVKGFRDLGVVAVSEVTLAGVPMLHAECRDGSAADFPASSVHFIAWLPPGSPWPEKAKAITSGPPPGWSDDWGSAEDSAHDERSPF